MLNQVIIILPEIILALIAISMQLFNIFSKLSTYIVITITIIFGLFLVGYLSYYIPDYEEVAFFSSFVTSATISLFKAIILALSLMSALIYRDLMLIKQHRAQMEFVTLVLLSTLGIFIAISARDFMLLFCGLELQALSSYALTAFNTKQSKSAEAALKYFILGALVSCLLLLGISFLYGFSGSIKFDNIQANIVAGGNIGIMIGSVLVITALLFKLSAAPLHIWSPDVYEGAPIAAVSYFATAQKVGGLLVLVNIIELVINDNILITCDLLKGIAIISMIIGSLGAIRQVAIKRMLAYSSILNIGYALGGICLCSSEGNRAAFVYILIYAISMMGFFACIVGLFGDQSDDVTFDHLKGIASKHKTIAAAIAILSFSMIGLPPFAGFFGKYYILYNTIAQGEIVLSSVILLTTVIAAFYYLKIIKYIYFMEEVQSMPSIATKNDLWIVTVLSLSCTLIFGIFAYRYI